MVQVQGYKKYGFTRKLIPFARNCMTGVATEGLRRGIIGSTERSYKSHIMAATELSLIKELKRENSPEIETLLVAALKHRNQKICSELKPLLEMIGPNGQITGTPKQKRLLVKQLQMIAKLKREVIGLLRQGQIQSESAIATLKEEFSITKNEL